MENDKLKRETIVARGVPSHVAIIMDGNGRWAKAKGLERWQGHKEGVEAVRRVMEASGEVGVKYLTLYAFSIENWNRPGDEVSMLMGLMVDAILSETANLMRQRVRVKAIGNLQDLPVEAREKLAGLIRLTEANDGLTVVLALSYGSRWEILQAAKRLAVDYGTADAATLDALGEGEFARYLTTAGIPDPDLLIRTSGECRLSNFLLWQIAYSELYFVGKFWPDFQKEDLYLAVQNFQQRERRFGMTGEQVKIK
ncbi:MAG: isoprenyl transferase [Odoribacteraceae bacterium]|jgi:undecaprenyl diphosphate synthase|nr:isoprenyl transferase [Odoribacteraceae bacterium]